MADTPIVTERQNLATLRASEAGGPGLDSEYWDVVSGAGVTNTRVDYTPGGSLRPIRLPGDSLPNQMTISRAYKPSRDDKLLQILVDEPDLRFDIDVQAWDLRRKVRAGAPRTYTRCIVSTHTHPNGNSQSGEPSRFEITLAPEAIIFP